MDKLILGVCVCFFLGLSACANIDSSDTQQVSDLPEITCVAVLPTMVPVSTSEALTNANKQGLHTGADFLDSLLMAELDAKKTFKVLSENQLDAILSNPWGGRVSQVATIGEATGCGAVLETSISRYRQRVGNDMSAEVSAAAAFSMELLGVTSGTVLWSTSFDETQKALFDNILSFSKAEKRGFKWLSVDELLGNAVKSRLADFPYFVEEDI